MFKKLVFIVFLFSILYIVSTKHVDSGSGGISRHSKGVQKLRSVLDEIVNEIEKDADFINEKFDKLKDSRKAKVYQALKKFQQSKRTERSAIQKRDLAQQKYYEMKKNHQKTSVKEQKLRKKQLIELNKEKIAIAKILGLIFGEIGITREHPAHSCAEVFKTMKNPKPGKYWIYVHKNEVARQYCIPHSKKKLFFSGSCNSHSRGAGWARLCLNYQDYFNAQKIMSYDTSGVITIKHSGVYKLAAHTMTYSSGWTSQHARIMRNGHVIAYTHDYGHHWMQHSVSALYPLNKGDKVWVEFHSASGNPYRYHAAGSHTGYNRFQISYERNLPVISAGCSYHQRGHGWYHYCLNSLDFERNNRGFLEKKSNYIEVKRNGLVSVKHNTMMHTNSWTAQYVQVFIGNRRVVYNHGSGYSWWTQQYSTYWPVNKGDKIYLQMYAASGNPYCWHAKSSTPGYSRLQVAYHGGKHARPTYSGGCSSHSRGTGWHTYYPNIEEWTHGPIKKFIKVSPNGHHVVQKPGVYRVNFQTISYTSNWGYRHIAFRVNNQIRAYMYDYSHAWHMERLNQLVALKKGDVLQVQVYCSGSNCYRWHSTASTHGYSRLQISYEGGL